MNRTARANDFRAVRRANALVAEAHSENRRLRSEVTYKLRRNSRLDRRAWPRRQNDVARSEGVELCKCRLVVAIYDCLSSKFANVPSEVVDEGVVVIDDQDHI